MKKINIAIAVIVAASLSACSLSSNYNAEICTSIIETQFESRWIESFAPAAKMEPDSCTMIVVTRFVSKNEDYDSLFTYELNANYKTFENGEFTYTHEVDQISIEQAPQRRLSKKELLEVAEKLDAKYGDQDICTGYLKALLNNEPTGTGQQMCQKPPQFRDY